MKYLIAPVQQTPNPAAHDPAAVPPFCEHSAEVKQVPLYPFVPKHWELANRTIENIDKTTNMQI